MSIVDKAIDFFEWIENDPVHAQFSDKLLLIIISVFCSATQQLPDTRNNSHCRERWIDFLKAKMPISFSNDPQLAQELDTWKTLKLTSTKTLVKPVIDEKKKEYVVYCHIIPRPWIEPPNGLHTVLEAFCCSRNVTHPFLPIPINELHDYIIEFKKCSKVIGCLGNTPLLEELDYPYLTNDCYGNMVRIKTVLRRIFEYITTIIVPRKMPNCLLVRLQTTFQDLSDSIDEMLVCCYEREFLLKDLFLFLSHFATRVSTQTGNAARCELIKQYVELVIRSDSKISKRLLPFIDECLVNSISPCNSTTC